MHVWGTNYEEVAEGRARSPTSTTTRHPEINYTKVRGEGAKLNRPKPLLFEHPKDMRPPLFGDILRAP
jgi:hypothetical protein